MDYTGPSCRNCLVVDFIDLIIKRIDADQKNIRHFWLGKAMSFEQWAWSIDVGCRLKTGTRKSQINIKNFLPGGKS